MNVKDKITEALKDGLFPNRCICGKWGEVLCARCYESIPKNKKDLCPICRKLSDRGRTCPACHGRSKLTGVMVFGKHERILKELIWNYKYEAIRDLKSPISALLLEKYSDFIKSKSFFITSVPISRSRITERGYNQAGLIALNIAEELGLESEDIFIKSNILPQVGLTRRQRIANIKGHVGLRKTCRVENKRILIVDDVYTTGSTLEECAKVLRKAGAREVWGIVLSRE